MFDCHYDLLSRLYYDYVKFGFVTSDTKQDLKIIFNNDNIKGCFANLYFMSEDEMMEEIGLSRGELSNVTKIFETSIQLLNDLKNCGVINKNIQFLYSIEGCDYIEDENTLDELYNLGLRSILLVWNNKNKYGSGVWGDYGLTEMGKNFIRHAINLGIIIDVSHANCNTFYDILEIVKEQKDFGKEVTLIASHSNSKDIQNVPRNLSYQQLVNLKDLDGYIGVVGYNPFISDIECKKNYLNHIKYMIKNVGFSYDRILLSSDNMDFLNNDESTFDIHNTKSEIKELLKSEYSDEIVEKMLYYNAKKLVK